MTEQQYLDQNLAGFENDSFAKEKMKAIITGNKIKTVIETGTYLGSTTKHFSAWTKQVHTIEVKESHFNTSLKALEDCLNVKSHLGNSPEVLDRILSKINKKELLFFFLDAHWEAFNPLLDELKVIAKHGFKPIIAIHDFKVPGHPEFGYDTYRGIVYERAWIEPSLINIYGKDGYSIEYNSQATGAKRGIIYIMPK